MIKISIKIYVLLNILIATFLSSIMIYAASTHVPLTKTLFIELIIVAFALVFLVNLLIHGILRYNNIPPRKFFK